MSHELIKKGDLVCLNPKKYDFSKSWGTGIVTNYSFECSPHTNVDVDSWDLVTVFWSSKGEEDTHLPTDLSVVQ